MTVTDRWALSSDRHIWTGIAIKDHSNVNNEETKKKKLSIYLKTNADMRSFGGP